MKNRNGTLVLILFQNLKDQNKTLQLEIQKVKALLSEQVGQNFAACCVCGYSWFDAWLREEVAGFWINGHGIIFYSLHRYLVIHMLSVEQVIRGQVSTSRCQHSRKKSMGGGEKRENESEGEQEEVIISVACVPPHSLEQ